MKPFKSISKSAPAIAPPVPRRKSKADEIKQQAILVTQPNQSISFWAEPESPRPNPLKMAIKIAAGVKPNNKATSGEPFGFCGSFELVSMILFSHFALQSTKPE